MSEVTPWLTLRSTVRLVLQHRRGIMAIFSEAEITLARDMRDLGLPWEPAAGHYVYDETNFCERGSPFQANVYFILNYDYFMQMVGGVEQFKAIMLWLPVWEDIRVIIRQFGYTDSTVEAYLAHRNSIAVGEERVALYEFVRDHLRGVPMN